jgi:membrane-associated phospholipid phosphatase
MLFALLATKPGVTQAAHSAPSVVAGARTELAPVAEQTNEGGQSEKSDPFLAAGEDPENKLISPFVHHFADDQKQFWTAPFHLNRDDARYLIPFAAFTGALFASDSWLSRQVPLSEVSRSKTFSDYATYALIGTAGASYLWGHMTHDDRLRETGLLATEAALNSLLVTYSLKEITGRERPYQGNGNGNFFEGGSSFPSEHSAIAWSIASIVAHEYPGPLTQIGAYGIASAITVTRVTAKQHFPADAVVGSALGWYFARQIYRQRHDPELGGAGWGEFVQDDDSEKPRNPDNMGSPYVPIDSWVYPVLERLTALGKIQTAFVGMRPWTRMQIAQLLEEAEENTPESEASGVAQGLVAALKAEFTDETHHLDGDANVGVTLDSLYSRVTGIMGPALQDGYHFGQTLINDYGRPYGEGFNDISGISSYGLAGPFSFYLRGEYQHAPSGPGLTDEAAQVIGLRDNVPAPEPGVPVPATGRLDLLEGYVGLQLQGWQLTFGRQELWWGPDSSGPMMYSNNSAPMTMLQLTRVKPFTLPSIFGIVGPIRTQYFLGRVTGQHWVYGEPLGGIFGSWTQPLGDQPFYSGEKISFKPTSNMEFGVSATVLFAGSGYPFTFHSLIRAMLSTSSPGPGAANDPGDRQGAFDWAYRIPKLRNWLTFYGDAYTEDQANPWFAWNKSAVISGLYMPQIPKVPKLDLRLEGMFTDLPGGTATISNQPGFFFYNLHYRSGLTNDGNIIGSWIGRMGQGAEVWSNYWLSPKNKLQLHFRHQMVDQKFITGGGALTDIGGSADFWVNSQVGVSGTIQYERWNFPVLASGPQTNVTAQFQMTFHPRWTLK